MDIPQITIDGKVYKMPKKPKMNIFGCLVEFEDKQKTGEIQGQEILTELCNVVSVAFNNEDVTGELVEANLDFEELIDVFVYINKYVKGIYDKKIAQLPKNVIAPAKI